MEKMKTDKRTYYLISCITIVVFLSIWYLLSDVLQIFRNSMLPGPLTILQTFLEKLTSKAPDGNTLGGHIVASLIVVLTGYLIGVFVGIPTGILMAWYKPVDYLVRPVFDFLRTCDHLCQCFCRNRGKCLFGHKTNQ